MLPCEISYVGLGDSTPGVDVGQGAHRRNSIPETDSAYRRCMAYEQPPVNPFAHVLLNELHVAAMDTVRELAEARERTPDERRALVLRCRHLLLAMAMRIAPGDHMPHEPEHRLEDAGRMAEAFSAWAESQCKQARFLAGSRAVDWAQRKAGLDLPVRYRLAYETDEALRDSLEELQRRCVGHIRDACNVESECARTSI